MGTNYYLHEKPPCECCKRPYEALHIGKSSAGWCFTLHIDPDEGINDLPDWVERWSRPGARIVDEYGAEIFAAEMLACITKRKGKRPDWSPGEYYRNYAEPGPDGLVRYALMRGHCKAHGEGTWDLILGEFS